MLSIGNQRLIISFVKFRKIQDLTFVFPRHLPLLIMFLNS